MIEQSQTVPLFIRPCDSQKFFGISQSTMYRAVDAGKITLYKFGGASLLKVTEVTTYIEGSAEESQA